MLNDDYAARAHSAWFDRTLDALQRRQPAIAALLPSLAAAPLDAAAVSRCWEHVASLSIAGGPSAAVAGRAEADPAAALRRTRQLLVLAIIERDVRQEAPLAEVCGAISAWARIAVGIAVRHSGAALAAIHGRPLDAEGRAQDMMVVGMGKVGGDELNVSSDIDLVFVARDDGETEGGGSGDPLASNEFFHRVARRTAALLSDVSEDGFVFRVDTRLRPNGLSGPLVCTLPMLEHYFFDQGREWERFAWLKGRVIADTGLADEASRRADEAHLMEIVEPFVFRRYLDFAAFGALRELHRLIRVEADKRDARRDSRDGGGIDVKVGRGGIREVEFCAQLFQIVRGGRDPKLRDRRTLVTLVAIAQRRLLEPAAAVRLAGAYTLLRRVEHALQYQQDAQTHRLPDEPEARARIATMLGMTPPAFDTALASAREHVATVFEALLAEPAAAGETGGESPTAALELDATGLARVAALREGRRYRLARPDTQRWIDVLLERALREGRAGTGTPGVADNAWVGRLADLLETVAGRPAYLALLVQYPRAFRFVLGMIGQAQWAANYLMRHPVVLDELLDGQILEPTDFAQWERDLRRTLEATTTRSGEPDIERRMDLLREWHHAQVFRLLAQDLAGRLSVERVSDHLSELADRVLAIVLDFAWKQVRHPHRDVPRFAVVAYGKLGGKELGYASDLDLVFVYDEGDDVDERAQVAYTHLARLMTAWLSTFTAAGLLFEIDLRLRPNGDAGLVVASLRAFELYQRESAWVWEHQALTRARFAAGDAALGARFETLRREILSAPRDCDALAKEVRTMRKRMLDGHPNRSTLFDVKHDRGGMVDIEFIVQYLVLAHASTHPELLDDVGNIELLERAARAGLVDAKAATACAQAYRDFRRMQHVLRLNATRYARVEPETATAQRTAVRALWRDVFGAD
jgi:[glutamine synthetase] adenylyltransferase / [glutamine synthetase]-adenylyl-L-tyrosine phosphorylase